MIADVVREYADRAVKDLIRSYEGKGLRALRGQEDPKDPKDPKARKVPTEPQ